MSKPASPPAILAVASGKGGVGKTMVTVACAFELSQAVPTLVIDLDFFNRGLSGLFHGRRVVGLIARPCYLDGTGAPPVAPWRVVEVETNLFHIAYPDLVPDELVRLEGRSADLICSQLRDFIQRAAAICGARAVVLDCHGGPDHTSFAAALVANHTLLVSEPDRITLHGTLNFLRQLRRGADSDRIDIRLIFNKVISTFRPAFLRRMYRNLLAPEFGGRDLLATFPLELPLTKAFEETPIITEAYPYSLLAKKTRVLLADLFEGTHPELLTRRIKTLPNWLRRRYRRTMGRRWWILNESLPLGFLVAGAILALLLYIPTDSRTQTIQQHLMRAALIVFAESNPADIPPGSYAALVIEEFRFLPKGLFSTSLDDFQLQQKIERALPGPTYSLEHAIRTRDNFRHQHEQDVILRYPVQWQEALKNLQPSRVDSILVVFSSASTLLLLVPGVLSVAWLAVALYVQWTTTLDRRFTRAARIGKWGVALWYVCLASAMWQLPSYMFMFLVAEKGSEARWAFLPAAALLILPFLGLVVQQSYLIYRDLRYDPHWRESFMRLAFLASLPVGGLIFYLFRH
jgi:cellulose biosynthesis protein BcsQ